VLEAAAVVLATAKCFSSILFFIVRWKMYEGLDNATCWEELLEPRVLPHLARLQKTPTPPGLSHTDQTVGSFLCRH
jgi:hypothetical protein